MRPARFGAHRRAVAGAGRSGRVADPPSRLEQAWRAVGWLGVAGVIVLSLIPEPPTVTPFAHEDKFGHMAAYAALMLWFAHLHPAPRARSKVALGLLMLGVALEFVQGWLGARTFSLPDMGADALGIALGWLAAPPRGPHLLAGLERRLGGRA